MASSDNTRDDCLLTPSENMESTICLLTEWTLKASGHLKADGVFMIKKGACAAEEDSALHLEREFGHVPKSIAYAFVEMWKQTPSLVISKKSLQDFEKVSEHHSSIKKDFLTGLISLYLAFIQGGAHYSSLHWCR